MSERELTDLTAQTPQTESDSVGASDSSPTISPMDSPMESADVNAKKAQLTNSNKKTHCHIVSNQNL